MSLFCPGAARVSLCRMFVALFFVMTVVVTGAASANSAPSAVILMYHRFGDSRYPSTNIRMDQLKAQVDYLLESGFTILPLKTVVESVRQGISLPDKSVAITVDDAFASVYDHGYPFFKRLGLPFTVFVCTDPVDAGRKDYMSWDQMREMKAHGVTFANHGARHDHLIERLKGEDEAVWLARIKETVLRGGERLKAELGETLPYLAYPYGEHNTQVAKLVAKLGYVAFGQQSGAFGVYSDLKRVPRFPISEVYGKLPAFKTKVKSLPMPVVSITPWDPVTTSRQPVLVIELSPNENLLLDEMACYVAGQGQVEIEWLEQGKRFQVKAPKELPLGRTKYNFTVPTHGRQRYIWFSRQWVIEEPGSKKPSVAVRDRSKTVESGEGAPTVKKMKSKKSNAPR